MHFPIDFCKFNLVKHRILKRRSFSKCAATWIKTREELELKRKKYQQINDECCFEFVYHSSTLSRTLHSSLTPSLNCPIQFYSHSFSVKSIKCGIYCPSRSGQLLLPWSSGYYAWLPSISPGLDTWAESNICITNFYFSENLGIDYFNVHDTRYTVFPIATVCVKEKSIQSFKISYLRLRIFQSFCSYLYLYTFFYLYFNYYFGNLLLDSCLSHSLLLLLLLLSCLTFLSSMLT